LDSLACARRDLKVRAGDELHPATKRKMRQECREDMKRGGRAARLSPQWVGLPVQNK
jgi:hypothetical protein